jgi:long-subunit acyl-CoA synthetase (AMP-forming)
VSKSCVPRGLCVGIYATNSAEACQYVIQQANVSILIVENDQQLQKILLVSAWLLAEGFLQKPSRKTCF